MTEQLNSLVSLALRPLTRRKKNLVILIYHRVHEPADMMFPNEMTAAIFEEQMVLIAKHMAPIPLTEAVARLARNQLPERAVVVTFDDGYADNATVAAPILRSTGVPATFFIASGYLDGGRMWNDTVTEAVRALPSGEYGFSELGVADRRLEDYPSRRRFSEEVIDAIKYRPQSERQRLAEEIAQDVVSSLPTNLMMTSDQVRMLSNTGIEIGAHTVSHPILKGLDMSQARREILDGKRKLEQIVGQPVRLFAYPNGRPGIDYDEEHVRIVRDCGFDAAVTTKQAVCGPGADLWQLSRLTPWDRRPERFLARILLGLS